MKYLHVDAEGVYHLDHRLTPEVRGMLCAMSSRMPAGGISARYIEVVEAIVPDLWKEAKNFSDRGKSNDYWFAKAEKRLCKYPLHPKVQVFFDKFVKMYGHSSIMELTGSPSVYAEGISWYDAWLMFDNPLVSGQEFSTRAVRHKNWPMARSCNVTVMYGAAEPEYVGKMPPRTEVKVGGTLPIGDIEVKPHPMPHPKLQAIHDGWFEVFEAEVNWWKKEFQSPCPKCADVPQAVKDAFRANEHLRLIRWDGGVHLSQGGAVLTTSSTRAELKAKKCKKDCTAKLGAPSVGRVGCTACDWSDAAPVPVTTFEPLWDYFADTEHSTHERCLPCEGTGKKHPTADKEPFRPALDRARWAIPGTIATGCAHTGNLRTMARVLKVGSLLAQRGAAEAPLKVWEGIQKGYQNALPGMAEMGLREAVYKNSSNLPAHVIVGQVAPSREVELRILPSTDARDLSGSIRARSPNERSYLDAQFNQYMQVEVAFQCSLAVARDWHRHRTMLPWFLDVVWDKGLGIHPSYEPMSDIGKARVPDLLKMSTATYREFMGLGNQMQAMLALPLGTHVQMQGQGGLRDMVYMLELRYHAHGANFEYKAQAKEALAQLQLLLEAYDIKFADLVGLRH